MNTKDDPVVAIVKTKPGFAKTWPAYLILLVALSATVIGWWMTRDQVETKVQAVISDETNLVVNKLSQGVHQSHEVLRSFQGLYGNSPQVVRDVFELFAGVPADMYEGVTSIGFAPHISSTRRDAFLLYARNEGYANFSIQPDGERSEYYPVEFIVPALRLGKIGQDLGMHQHLVSTISEAMTNKGIVASPVVPLVTTGERGLYFLAAVSNPGESSWSTASDVRRPLGVVFMEMNLSAFLENTLRPVADPDRIEFTVYDSDVSKDHEIYHGIESPDVIGVLEKRIDIGGRTWILVFRGREALAVGINRGLPLLVLLGGCGISVLLFGFTLSLLTSRSRALDLAERITRSQRRIVDSSQDIIGIVGKDGKWKTVNPAVTSILGYRIEDMIGMPHAEVIASMDREKVHQALAAAPDERPMEYEARYQHRDGGLRWLNWSVTASASDGLLYLIGHDVTERRLAEEKIQLKNKQLDLAGLLADHENKIKETNLRTQSLELRTQLTGIMGFLDLVLADAGLSREEELDFVRTAHESAVTLLDSFQSLTQLTFAKTGDLMTVQLTPTPASALISNLQKDLAELGFQVSPSTTPTPPERVSTLPERTNQSLRTLANAYRRSGEEKVTLSVESSLTDQALRIIFEFSSSGPHPEVIEFMMRNEEISAYNRDEETYAIGVARMILGFSNAVIHTASKGTDRQLIVEFPLILV